MRIDMERIRQRWKETCQDVDAMLDELERLYAASVVDPAREPTPGERARAVAEELHRMIIKPRGGSLS